MKFICPICREKLNISDNAAVCKMRHSFDKSKYGYFNLLPPKVGTHGDNREMVLARRAFLSGGYYEPLRNKIAALVSELLPFGGAVLDAGCGEGYYTLGVKLGLQNGHNYISAFDISKDAVREACKKKCADEYAVASSYHMPYGDSEFDLVLNTFSPQAPSEVRRVLKTGGFFVMAIPGEEHLFGLKRTIYETPYKNTVEDTAIDGFNLVSSHELRYTLELNTGDDVRNLFMMTPYAYRTKTSDREKILSMNHLTTDAHFYILVYRKEGE